MVTLAQRIEELRTERGLSRPALSAALGLPKLAIERFEQGRQTPTQEQQKKLANYFGVSTFYLRGESQDRTSMENWMDIPIAKDAEEPEEKVSVRKSVSTPKKRNGQTAVSGGAGKPEEHGSAVLSTLLGNRSFQETLRATILEVLRSPEGQEILGPIVRRELDRQR